MRQRTPFAPHHRQRTHWLTRLGTSCSGLKAGCGNVLPSPQPSPTLTFHTPDGSHPSWLVPTLAAASMPRQRRSSAAKVYMGMTPKPLLRSDALITLTA